MWYFVFLVINELIVSLGKLGNVMFEWDVCSIL